MSSHDRIGARLYLYCSSKAARELFWRSAILIGAASILLSLFSSLARSEAELKKVRAAYAGPGGGFAITWIAKEARLFSKYGLDAELIRIPTTPRLVQAVIGGDVQFAHTGGVSTVTAIARGAELAVLAQTSRGYSGHMVVRPALNSLQELKGKNVGITQYGSTGDLFLREGLRRWNLKPDKDVAILQIGGTAEIFSALVAGRLDGAVLSTELALRARKAGFKILFDFSALDIREMGTSLIANRSFIAKDEDAAAKNFLKAFVEAIYLYKTNKDLSLKVLQKYTRNDDLELLAAVREAYTKGMDPIPYPREEDLMGSLNRLKSESSEMEKRISRLSVQDFLETKYLRELERSGFIRSLYKS
ncbi:MAG: ABC transporter substrate-binding protein [Deltaproteobacteria bacterium]|nr:ABC transporter substrate-binding protein [Deltaproteobacteria bacterium]